MKKEKKPFVSIGIQEKNPAAFPATGSKFLDLADIALGLKKPDKPRRKKAVPEPPSSGPPPAEDDLGAKNLQSRPAKRGL